MIRFEHVTKRYEGASECVFEDFNTVIKEGEFILLTGESGAGKTTFLRMLLKDTEVTDGKICVLDQDIGQITGRDVPFYRRKMGIVFQEEHYLLPEKTVYENIEFARMAVGGRRKDSRMAIAALFTLLGISQLHKRYPAQLSGGQLQKVCLARALVNYPVILLADEPTGNLSPGESREIMRLFELVHSQGMTVIVATHDKESAQGLEYREIALTNYGVGNLSGNFS